MRATEIREGIYWVGAIDWHIRNFHGYTTNRGATYNAYLILDEKVTLIDTVKEGFSGELLERISDVIDPAKIDYIISNHVEMDHSGALPAMVRACPNATIITSAPSGLKGLSAHYGNLNYKPMKTGDSLNIGRRNLTFVTTPMLHWPDNMVTYCPEERILFSNDAFGQHYATSERFDDETDLAVAMEEAKKYYANIVMCYGRQAAAAWNVVHQLGLDMIAPSHGIIWRSHIDTIMDAYKRWSANEPESGAMVVFDSMWHSTEMMAKTIAEAFADKGVSVKLYDLKNTHRSEIVPEILERKYIAVGSPTLNNQMMPEVAAFLCYLKGLSPKNRKAFAFGSYGWGGQSIGQVEDELKACGFEICLDKIRVNYIPKKEDLKAITEQVERLFD